jgi:thioesterase domain-containing protein
MSASMERAPKRDQASSSAHPTVSPAAREIERYLHANIPLSTAMGLQVLAASRTRVTIFAPLAPNINHRSTAFGGSVSAVAILAGWAWLHLALHEARLSPRVVIQRNSIEYLAPVQGDFTSTSVGLAPAAFDKFVRQLGRVGKARATIAAEIIFDGKVAATLSGDYVALASD